MPVPNCHQFDRIDFQKDIMTCASRLLAPVAAALLLTACATTPQPLPFDLVDKANVPHRGLFKPADNSIEVRVVDKVYKGFYVISSSTARSTEVGFGVGFGGYGRYGYSGYGAYPSERWTVISNNNGRAHLQNAEGDRLNCEFMFEGRRLLGECRSPQGAVYQMVANQAVANPTPAPSPATSPQN